MVHPSHDFSDKGFDHDSDVEESDLEDQPAKGSPKSEGSIKDVGVDDGHDGGFDDEVVSDDDGDVSVAPGSDEGGKGEEGKGETE